MAIRPILYIPDPRLKQVTAPVTEITDETRALVKDMFETMYDAPGIGLAAPQIGVMQRIVVIDCAKRADDAEVAEGEEEISDPITLINPEITWVSEETRVYEEGCLSIPEYYEEVERPDRIRIRYMNLEGETIEREADGLLATCMQHEVDHLNGKLFIDYLSRLKRERITKKFEKAARRAAE
ncbi:peptide deformylase [Mariluticola halotolerans]|uniref:peptide deformylase n=1 Tax=Mariluticola halotolerans TaxID=2909283 RepID=UPI0026E49114|nr:peptide deformylase [Mariluticola halotolerans]UJQ93146.1 peptide deformylase [Mariluticola halotolerans]